MLLLADTTARASNIGAGAVLTLVVPIGFVLLVLAWWWFVQIRHREP